MHCWRPAQWMDWIEAPKHFPKPYLQEKKCHGKRLVVCCQNWSTTAFWIPAKPLHLRSMLSKSMRCTENCNAWSRHWSTERAQFFCTTAPNPTLHKQHFKSWTNWATQFYFICHIHPTSCQLTTTSSSILTTFCRENFHNQNEAKNAFQESVKSGSMDFYAVGIKLIYCWQKCVDCNGSYFD